MQCRTPVAAGWHWLRLDHDAREVQMHATVMGFNAALPQKQVQCKGGRGVTLATARVSHCASLRTPKQDRIATLQVRLLEFECGTCPCQRHGPQHAPRRAQMRKARTCLHLPFTCARACARLSRACVCRPPGCGYPGRRRANLKPSGAASW